MTKTALVVVDLQNDFLPPNGSLAIANGLDIVPKIISLMALSWDAVVVTQDWHPPNHSSFASQHNEADFAEKVVYHPEGAKNADGEAIQLTQTLWPDHCVQNTPGAELDQDFSEAYNNITDHVPKIIIRKGQLQDREFYSCFQDCWGLHKTEIDSFLRQNDIKKVVFAGLAYDFCVYSSAKDCAASGFKTYVLKDCTKSVFPDKVGESDVLYQSAGVNIISTASLSSFAQKH